MLSQSALRSPEQQAERAANEHYAELQSEVIGEVRHKLSARKMWLDQSDLEEAYCQAWQGVCVTIGRGTVVSNLTGLLIEIAWRRAVDLYREMHVGQQVDFELAEQGVCVDLDEQLDDRIKLKRFIARARGRLNPRECEAVSLCYIHGYTRPEAAELLGLKGSQMQRLMDRATKKIGGIVGSIEARGCGGEEWAALMKSYALGTIAEEHRDHLRAAAHVGECDACRRYVNALRGLTAILPPVLPFGPAGAAGHGAGSILAQLERLFGNGHGGVEALRTAGAGAGATGGATGSGLLSSLGAGTVAKGVAVIAAGAIAVGVAAHRSRAPHRVVTRGAPAVQAQSYPPAGASVLGSAAPARSFGPAKSHPRRAHQGRHTLARPRTRVVSATRGTHTSSQTQPAYSTEFGFEGTGARTPETPSAHPASGERSESAPTSTEFGFER